MVVENHGARSVLCCGERVSWLSLVMSPSSAILCFLDSCSRLCGGEPFPKSGDLRLRVYLLFSCSLICLPLVGSDRRHSRKCGFRSLEMVLVETGSRGGGSISTRG